WGSIKSRCCTVRQVNLDRNATAPAPPTHGRTKRRAEQFRRHFDRLCRFPLWSLNFSLDQTIARRTHSPDSSEAFSESTRGYPVGIGPGWVATNQMAT